MNSPRRESFSALVFTRACTLPVLRQFVLAAFLLALLTLPLAAHAQTFVYVNNQDVVNSVAGFSVSPTGSLTPVPGSPYPTGGSGSTTTCQGLDRIITSAANNLLFVSNSGDQTISVFQIDPTSGALTAAPGSPFASGLTLDSCQGISLAVTPDGALLMASSNGIIQGFSVAANGILMPGPQTANCCSPTVGMKISSQGNVLAISNESSVSVYTINPDGSLVAITGSPFPRGGTGLLTSVDFSCAGDRLYGSESSFTSSTITDAWTVAGGVLTPVLNSPFSGAGVDSTSVVLTPDNTTLFTNEAFSNKIDSFHVNADGSLSTSGSFGGVGTVHAPSGLATDASGSFLFAADDGFGVAVFKINGTGTLTGAADVALDRVGTVQGVAAYPPRACISGDLSLTMTADATTVESGSNVNYTITITNNGTTPASATVVDNLPTGESFVLCKSTTGACSQTRPNPHTIVFTGLAAGASASATITAATDANLLNGTVVTNTATIANKSIIDTNPANDSASVAITMTAQPGPTTLTVSPATGSFGGLAILTATLAKTSNGALISGKTVSFTLNGNAAGTATTNSVGQAILTISVAGLPLGTYPGAIGASFAGDSLFNASSGTGDLTVAKSVLTVIPASASRLYGDPNPASFAYNITGFLNGDTSAVVSGTATCSTTATITSPVGSYPVNCDVSGLSAANYTFTVFPGTLTINPAPLTVTADNQTRAYGDPNPVFTGTVTGLKNGDIITPTYTTTATVLASVGTYPIVPFIAATPVAANYTITYVNGTLTVTPATLTVTVNNATRFYGDPNPVFTATIVGLKNNDNITASLSTTATQASPIGTYPITATLVDPGLKLSNYTVTITNGTLTIVPAPLTVTVDSVTRLYGDPNPLLTGTIVGVKNGDNITATYSTTATQASPVGTYPIIATLVDPGNKLSNYSVTINNGTLTINPAPLTVTITNASRVYGDPNPTFNGSISGLKNGDNITATYTSVGPTASVGTYPITPVFNDPGNKLSNYTVNIVGGVLTITKAPLSVVAPNKATRVYGDPNPLPTITGIKNGDNITATFTTPTATSPVGAYTLVPVLVDPTNKLGNYNVTITNGSLTITPAPLTVVANSATRSYGSANPTFSGTITGVKNGENITASFTTTATQTSNVGTFTITASAVFNPTTLSTNYTVSATNGTLTITAVPLTIAANNQTVILNGALPCTGSACATYSGFVLGQTPSNLSGSLSCSLVKGSGNVGTFAPPNGIQCSGQSSTNYTITFVQGTYKVQYEPAGFTCSNGPGHVILAPIAANGSSVFTKSTTPTVAVQFRVCGVSGSSVNSTVVSNFVLTSVNGVAASTPGPQGGPFTFVGGTLAGGAGSAGWQFNLSTGNLTAGNTYAYQINLNDGTSITFQFKLQ